MMDLIFLSASLSLIPPINFNSLLTGAFSSLSKLLCSSMFLASVAALCCLFSFFLVFSRISRVFQFSDPKHFPFSGCQSLCSFRLSMPTPTCHSD